MLNFCHHAVDDVDGLPVSTLSVRAIPGLPVCIAIDPADLSRDRVHHWLTPIAEAELLKALQARQRPVIPMRP